MAIRADASMIAPSAMIAQNAPCSRNRYCAKVPRSTSSSVIERTNIAPTDRPSAMITMLLDSANAPITPSKLNEASSTLR